MTAASSVAAFTETGAAETFHVSHEVTILGISLFVAGLGVGPLLVGPLSEVYGRNIIYRASYSLFFVFTFPVAFAPNTDKRTSILSLLMTDLTPLFPAVFLIFRLLLWVRLFECGRRERD